jgi:hypothetical protein
VEFGVVFGVWLCERFALGFVVHGCSHRVICLLGERRVRERGRERERGDYRGVRVWVGVRVPIQPLIGTIGIPMWQEPTPSNRTPYPIGIFQLGQAVPYAITAPIRTVVIGVTPRPTSPILFP